MSTTTLNSYTDFLCSVVGERQKAISQVPDILQQARKFETQYILLTRFNPQKAEEYREQALTQYRQAAFFDPGNEMAMAALERLASGYEF